MGGITYASYNIVGAVIVLPVLRHLTSQRDAIVSGIIAGPLAMAPAILFFVCMIAFYPAIEHETLPSDFMLTQLNMPLFHLLFQFMIFAALLESGTGSVHAINERIAGVWRARRGKELSTVARAVIAASLLIGCIFVANYFGLVALIANGYRLPGMNSSGAFQPTSAGPLHAVSDDVVWWFPPSSLATMTPRELNVVDGGSLALAVGPPITATHCYAPRECVVGNLFGQVGLFTGSAFLSHGAVSGVVTKLAPSAAGSVYVLTESGGLGHWRDGGVISVPLPPFISPGLRTVRDISVRPPDELWAAGIEPTVTQGGVFRLTSTGWQATGPLADAGWPFIPETVLVRSTSLAYVGGSGQFATWDGGVWNVQPLPPGFSMGFLSEVDGQVYSRSNGQLFRLTDAGVFEAFGPPRLPIATLDVSSSFVWMGFSSEAGVLRRPRP